MVLPLRVLLAPFVVDGAAFAVHRGKLDGVEAGERHDGNPIEQHDLFTSITRPRRPVGLRAVVDGRQGECPLEHIVAGSNRNPVASEHLLEGRIGELEVHGIADDGTRLGVDCV